MTKAELIHYLRLNVNIQNSEVTDTEYLAMTDDDIALYMQIVITREFPDITSLESVPNECIYPLILLSKKELYYALASKDAPYVDMVADNNNQLKRAQRFDHYLKLIAQVDAEYEQYIEDGGSNHNTLYSTDVLLPDRYNTLRNYEKGSIPIVKVLVDNVESTTIELQWLAKMSRFFKYEVYISKESILDPYNLENPISESAKKILTIMDVHQSLCRITGLEPDTNYHILVVAVERSKLRGMKEIQVVTSSISGGE